MPSNFESSPSRHDEVAPSAEATGETPREVNGERGRKTYEAAKTAEWSERKAEILRRKQEIDAELARLRGEPGSEPAAAESAIEQQGEETEEDKPSAEDIQTTSEKAKKNGALKNVLTGAAVIAVAGIIGVGIATGGFGLFGNNNSTAPEATKTTIVQTAPDSENAETEKGIYDGYNEKGMWLSEGKAGPYNFTNGSEVAEVCENDECEMIKYTAHNQVESLADYLANLPEELQPEGFKGLSILEAESRLEGLTPEEYDDVLAQFDRIMDDAFTRRVKVNGRQNNAYMSLRDASGPVVHENMRLVKCITNESDLEVVEFYWPAKDDHEIGSMRVKMLPVYDADGYIIGYNGCIQVITPDGEKDDIYSDLPEVVPDDPTPTPAPEDPTPTPPAPTPDPTPTPPPTPTNDWGKSGDPHGGDLVTPSGPVNPASEVSKEQNDSTNAGNQGYVDDHAATPGSSSESNGTNETGFASSGIVAPGATTEEGRLTGGENQAANPDGTSSMAGENAYQDAEAIAEGQANDAAGDAAQAEAQESGGTNGEGLAPGGDNYSDAEEEALVAGGNF